MYPSKYRVKYGSGYETKDWRIVSIMKLSVPHFLPVKLKEKKKKANVVQVTTGAGM